MAMRLTWKTKASLPDSGTVEHLGGGQWEVYLHFWSFAACTGMEPHSLVNYFAFCKSIRGLLLSLSLSIYLLYFCLLLGWFLGGGGQVGDFLFLK